MVILNTLFNMNKLLNLLQLISNNRFSSFTDSFGEDLIIDVGRCRRHCRHSDSVSKNEFMQLLGTHQNTDPIEVTASYPWGYELRLTNH